MIWFLLQKYAEKASRWSDASLPYVMIPLLLKVRLLLFYFLRSIEVNLNSDYVTLQGLFCFLNCSPLNASYLPSLLSIIENDEQQISFVVLNQELNLSVKTLSFGIQKSCDDREYYPFFILK